MEIYKKEKLIVNKFIYINKYFDLLVDKNIL